MKASIKLLKNLKFSEIEIKYTEGNLIILRHNKEVELEQRRLLQNNNDFNLMKL
jgi:hypothetical protein